MATPREIDEWVADHLAALPEGGRDLERCAEMVGAMVKHLRERRSGATPMAAVLRGEGFSDDEIKNILPSAFVFLTHLPRELWRFD